MTAITLFDRVLEALKLALPYVEAAAQNDSDNGFDLTAALAVNFRTIIAEADKANTLLPAPGKNENHSGAVIIPNVVIQDNRTPDEKAAQEKRNYDVMVRRPMWAYGRITIAATSAEAAVEETKVILTDVERRYERPDYDFDNDSMAPHDWISAESEYDCDAPNAAVDHAEWEEPKLSPGKLMAALHEIVRLHDDFTKDGLKNSGDVSPIKLAVLLNKMRSTAELAIAEAIPQS